jgi:uncharacterized protein (TIGR03435 family)
VISIKPGASDTIKFMRLAAMCTIALLPMTLAGQESTPLTFEVASVKPAGVDLPTAISSGPDRFNCLRCNLFGLITQAYAIFSYQLKAPEWTRTTVFDVVAKMPAGSKRENLRPMVENLLTERFKMVSHREEEEKAVYELVVAKGGPKVERVTESKPAPPPGPDFDSDGYPNVRGGTGFGFGNGRARIQYRAQIMKNFANILTSQVDRPVIDATGLEGLYALTLSYRMLPTAANDISSIAGDASLGPTIYEALEQQLGLKLKPGRRKIDTVVVDRLEKVPTEN